MKIHAVIAVAVLSSIAGCASVVPDPVDAPIRTWVERTAVFRADGLAPTTKGALVIGETSRPTPDPSERVAWTRGAHHNDAARVQRSAERYVAKDPAKEMAKLQAKAYFFEIRGRELTLAGRLAINDFKDEGATRFFVELFSDQEISEQSLGDLNQAYVDILVPLKEKGLDMSKVVFGGIRYKQPHNGIVLIYVR